MQVDVIDTDGRVLFRTEWQGGMGLTVPRDDLLSQGSADDFKRGVTRSWLQEFELRGESKDDVRFVATERPYMVEHWHELVRAKCGHIERKFRSKVRRDVRAPEDAPRRDVRR